MTRKPGVLPIGIAQVQTHNTADATKSGKGKVSIVLDGVKAKVRWLPPALTEDEFFNILGDTWKVGNGKGWLVQIFAWAHADTQAHPKDLSPAWARFRVKEEHPEDLAQAIRNAVWEDDTKGTFNKSLPDWIPVRTSRRAIYKKIPQYEAEEGSQGEAIYEDDE